MIREFEEIDTDRHDQDTDCDIDPFLQGYLLFLGHFASPRLREKDLLFPH